VAAAAAAAALGIPALPSVGGAAAEAVAVLASLAIKLVVQVAPGRGLLLLAPGALSRARSVTLGRLAAPGAPVCVGVSLATLHDLLRSMLSQRCASARIDHIRVRHLAVLCYRPASRARRAAEPPNQIRLSFLCSIAPHPPSAAGYRTMAEASSAAGSMICRSCEHLNTMTHTWLRAKSPFGMPSMRWSLPVSWS
jgi:hypothetical protein